MNDFEIMLDMFKRAKEKDSTINWSVGGSIDKTESYIYLHRHKFTFNSNGDLIHSVPTQLNDLS